MTRRTLLSFLSAVALVATAACSSDDSPTGPSLPPTGTAPYSQTDLRVGTGTEALSNSNITVNYTGWLYSNTAAENKGNVFDSGRLTNIALGGLIACWRQGVPGTRVGGVRRLVCPPELAYGSSTPDPSRMPPNATLLFEVELISVP
jgi:FKBP-type peptidyl-prolyl cis-trans isomerase FkpA